MAVVAIFIAQFLDPTRALLVLSVFLLALLLKGRVLRLAAILAGCLFVAWLIPFGIQARTDQLAAASFVIGVVSNAAQITVYIAARQTVRRRRQAITAQSQSTCR